MAKKTVHTVKRVVRKAKTMNAKELAGEANRQITKARTALDKADKRVSGYITRNPKKAVAIAAGVGAAVAGAVALAMRKK